MGRILFTLTKLLFAHVVLLSYVCEGSSGITSSFVRSEWPAIDIPLDNIVFTVPKGKNAPQQVHITQGDYDGRAVIISWVTPDEPGSSTVKYGTSEDKYEFVAHGTVTNYSFYNYKSGYIHHVLVNGLEHDQKYYYKIGNGASSRKFWFETPPKIDPDAYYKFGIIGDLGQTYNSLSTLEHYMQSGAKAVLFVGDLSYADKCPGEHVPFQSYLHRYKTPYAASQSSNPLYYAIRRASAHIIVLSSYSPYVRYTPQWIWLKEELNKVDREKTPWLIVLMHVPMYNSNDAHFKEGESMRVVFEEWFVQHKVDIIFAGHVHAYERSHRISNINYNVSIGECYPVPDKAAPVYITIGDGGNQEGLAARFRDPQPEYSAFREASYGHAILEIMNRTHAVYTWYRNDDGKKMHVDTIPLLNQYWAGKGRKRMQERPIGEIAT